VHRMWSKRPAGESSRGRTVLVARRLRGESSKGETSKWRNVLLPYQGCRALTFALARLSCFNLQFSCSTRCCAAEQRYYERHACPATLRSNRTWW